MTKGNSTLLFTLAVLMMTMVSCATVGKDFATDKVPMIKIGKTTKINNDFIQKYRIEYQ